MKLVLASTARCGPLSSQYSSRVNATTRKNASSAREMRSFQGIAIAAGYRASGVAANCDAPAGKIDLEGAVAIADVEAAWAREARIAGVEDDTPGAVTRGRCLDRRSARRERDQDQGLLELHPAAELQRARGVVG